MGFGDSHIIINWVILKNKIYNVEMSFLLNKVMRYFEILEFVDFKHIYKERNVLAYELAKVGTLMQHGFLHISENKLCGIYESILTF